MSSIQYPPLVAQYIWVGVLLLVLPAVVFWRSTFWLVTISLVFLACYVWLYFRLARWRATAPIPMTSSHSRP